MGEPLVDRSPRSFQMAACECMMWNVYLESVYMFAILLAARVRALVSAINSAFWEEVPEGRGWDSIILVSETIAYPATFFPSYVTEQLPSKYQVKSELTAKNKNKDYFPIHPPPKNKGVEEINGVGRKGASVLLMPLCKYG